MIYQLPSGMTTLLTKKLKKPNEKTKECETFVNDLSK